MVASAIQSVGLLCRGLSDEGREHAKALFPTVLNRLRDKKEVVLDACHATLKQLCSSMSLGDAWRFLESGAKSKVPNIRSSCLGMLRDYMVQFRQSEDEVPERIVPRISALLVLCSADTQAAVRDAAAASFGALLSVVGVELLEDSLGKIDGQKGARHFKAKVNEVLEANGLAPLPIPPADASKTTTRYPPYLSIVSDHRI